MTTSAARVHDVPGRTAPPSRFREAEARGARLGRVLRRLGRVREVDEPLMERIGVAMTQHDEVGARLARALRAPAGSPDRVTMGQLRRALADGVDTVPDAPPALRDFFACVEATPDWVDPVLLERGAAVYRRFGQNAADVLLQLSLIGGYRFGGPPDLLVATGGLAGDSTRRRLGETQKWTASVSEPGAMQRAADGTWGEGWRLTVHVRAMHALVDASFVDRWDVERWGLPVNQADQAATLGLFDAVVLLGVRVLGVPVSADDSRAVMHLWRYVGWLLGVDEQWLVDDERERHRLSYHLLRAQSGVTPAGAELSRDILAVVRRLPHGRFQAERTLSMLSLFLGRASMRDLGLPWRPPWAHAYVVVLNTLRYRVAMRTTRGRAWVDRWAEGVVERVMAEYFGDDERRVGALPG